MASLESSESSLPSGRVVLVTLPQTVAQLRSLTSPEEMQLLPIFPVVHSQNGVSESATQREAAIVPSEQQRLQVCLQLGGSQLVRLQGTSLSGTPPSLPDRMPTLSSIPPSRKGPGVKTACVNCRKAGKRCDPGRPCSRCLKMGLEESCKDAPTKRGKSTCKHTNKAPAVDHLRWMTTATSTTEPTSKLEASSANPNPTEAVHVDPQARGPHDTGYPIDSVARLDIDPIAMHQLPPFEYGHTASSISSVATSTTLPGLNPWLPETYAGASIFDVCAVDQEAYTRVSEARELTSGQATSAGPLEVAPTAGYPDTHSAATHTQVSLYQFPPNMGSWTTEDLLESAHSEGSKESSTSQSAAIDFHFSGGWGQ